MAHTFCPFEDVTQPALSSSAIVSVIALHSLPASRFPVAVCTFICIKPFQTASFIIPSLSSLKEKPSE